MLRVKFSGSLSASGSVPPIDLSMIQKNVANLLLPALLVPLSLVVMINLLSGGGNQLGNTFNLLMLLGAGIGLLAPRAGLLIFIVLQFYMDFMKRMLVLGDALSMQDVMSSLGLGPIIVVAVCVVCTWQCLTGKVPFLNLRDIVFFLGCVGVSLMGLAIGREVSDSSDIADIGQALLGSAMLGMTAYAAYVLFRQREDSYTALKWMVVGAIPMALYTFYQYIFGISEWEEAYIRTGLSQVLYTFYMLDGIHEMRPFSTLNTHTSLGTVSGILFLVSFLIMTRSRTLFQTGRNNWPTYSAIALLFLGSCFISRNRTTYLIPFAGLFLPWIFSGGWRTLLFYLSACSLFVWIVAKSQWLNDQILYWSVQFEATAIGEKFGTLGTYQARLNSLMSLSDSRNWTPFGLPKEEYPYMHDQVTELLVKLGYVPLLGLLLLIAVTIFWWHARCLKIKDLKERRFLITLTTIIVSLGVCGVAYGNLLFVAPVNSVLGVMLGLGMAGIRRDQESTEAKRLGGTQLASAPSIYHPGSTSQPVR